MEFRLHQNAVLTGSIDSFCLLCETHLRSVEDACSHVAIPLHQENLSALQYVEKFKEENIRKVKSGYYCEYCNILVPTMVKAELHVSSDKHRTTKGTTLLQRVGGSIVAFRNATIKEAAWNGFVNNICVLCSTEFESENIHKSSAQHLINLIRSNVEFTPEEYIYRKIDDVSFHCLTCNKELANESRNAHFEDQIHKDLYNKCCFAKPPMYKKIISSLTAANKSSAAPKKPSVVPNKPSAVANQASAVPDKSSAAPNQASVVPNQSSTVDNKSSAGANMSDALASIYSGAANKAAQYKPTADKSKEDNAKKDRIKKIENHLEMEKIICKVLKAPNYIAAEGDTFICILCEMTFRDKRQVTEHVTGKYHLTLLKLHEEQSKDKNRASAEKTPQSEKAKILGRMTVYQDNDININFEMRTAYCKMCEKYINFDNKVIEEHVKDHIQKSKKQEIISSSFDVKTDEASTSSKTVAEKKTTLYSSPVHFKSDKTGENSPKNYAKNNAFYSAELPTSNSSTSEFAMNEASTAKLSTNETGVALNEASTAEVCKNEAGVVEVFMNEADATDLPIREIIFAEADTDEASSAVASNKDNNATELVIDIAMMAKADKNEASSALATNKESIATGLVIDLTKMAKANKNEASSAVATNEDSNAAELAINLAMMADVAINDACAAVVALKEANTAEAAQNEASPVRTIQNEANPAGTVQNEASPDGTVQNEASPDGTVRNEASPDGTVQNEASSTSDAAIKRPTPTIQQEMVALGKKNEMSYHPSDRCMMCHVCDVKVPANINNINQHSQGFNHVFAMNQKKKRDYKPKPKVNLHKIPSGEFVDTVATIENVFLKEVIVNERFCISANSFMLIMHSEFNWRCLLCYCNVSIDCLNAHCKLPAHVRAMTEAPVILTLHDEFVREIHPDEFHCGYCNISQFGYSNLENHLKTVTHRETKKAANNRLQKYEDSEDSEHRQVELMMLFGLLNNF